MKKSKTSKSALEIKWNEILPHRAFPDKEELIVWEFLSEFTHLDRLNYSGNFQHNIKFREAICLLGRKYGYIHGASCSEIYWDAYVNLQKINPYVKTFSKEEKEESFREALEKVRSTKSKNEDNV